MSEQDRHRLLQRLRGILGDEEAATLMENLPPRPWSELATKTDLDRFATKTDLEKFATKTDLERFATKTDLERFASKADLERFATKTDLERFASKADLERFATKTDLERFASKADLERFATSDDLEDLRDDVTELDVKLRTLDRSLDLRFERSEARMETLVHRTVTAQTRVLFVGLLGSVLTAAALAFGAAAV